jgi:subtilisin family serine protease
MAIPIPRALVEFILLGPEDDRRQLQDSPILGDVWVRFAEHPGRNADPPDHRLELLITPYKDHPAGVVASELLDKLPPPGSRKPGPNIAYLQGVVAARLSFRDVVHYVIPMSYWWGQRAVAKMIAEYRSNTAKLTQDINTTLEMAEKWARKEHVTAPPDFDTRKRYIALAGLILWAEVQPRDLAFDKLDSKQQIVEILNKLQRSVNDVVSELISATPEPREQFKKDLVFTVSLNRRATPALTKSVPAVKGDAARGLFKVNCSEIVWAVLDSGVHANHPAFATGHGDATRVVRSFDFTKIRQIVSLDNLRDDELRRERAETLTSQSNLVHRTSVDDASEYLKQLAKDAKRGRPVDWEMVERLVEIEPLHELSKPEVNHGTHVAGIIGASREGAIAANRCLIVDRTDGQRSTRAAELEEPRPTPQGGAVAAPSGVDHQETQPAQQREPQATGTTSGERSADEASEYDSGTDWADGMCPDIKLYDFRVLGPTLDHTEFAVIAALQFIRHVNERHSYPTIHGANLSLSIPHDVRNYACGRTPVCNECERLVGSGVVVVAAAGNRGYQNFETKDGLYEGYAAFSVTDPGNADGVITVGSTHRFWAHTYGVSFFSSRGPTGDGRLKPDLVAPGERIRAPLPGTEWGDLDGTSMAAPHVSGAAAMLMARYSELIGQPRRIKQILCDSATDLGREKSFQGHGMLDVLRAFQSI